MATVTFGLEPAVVVVCSFEWVGLVLVLVDEQDCRPESVAGNAVVAVAGLVPLVVLAASVAVGKLVVLCDESEVDCIEGSFDFPEDY